MGWTIQNVYHLKTRLPGFIDTYDSFVPRNDFLGRRVLGNTQL
jgi:hypothetical protein